ncbi:MAG: hypothetical protein ACU0A5_14085 [Salipiger marinus]|uniref:hypothetical protein n=1 Tax=Salipiger marinus TaxID=555512 RepID=UPI004058A03F
MALRARLTPPRETKTDWPWHKVKSSSLSASLLFGGGRRMEAENFLASGFGTRIAIEAKSGGWSPLSTVARTWQPSRLKGIQVSREFGTPFLAATQVFDVRPVPRKWLSLDRTDSQAERFVAPGTILVTCSGSVGRATLADASIANTLISHDLLRIDAVEESWWGWTYAYLRAPTVRAMMKAAQYGHIIKHLEIQHLDSLPILRLSALHRSQFVTDAKAIISARDSAHALELKAEEELLRAVGAPVSVEKAANGFTTRASAMFGRGRRLEGNFHNPNARAAEAAIRAGASRIEIVEDLVERVFVPGRFKHVYGDEGIPYLDSAQILEVAPDIDKRVLSLKGEKKAGYVVDAGTLLIPCSGQLHGIVGSVILATEWHESKVLTNHILRVVPKKKSSVRIGYLQAVLGHPTLGRPRILKGAFGSSVPEIGPEDIKSLTVPRFDASIEDAIADAMEEAANLRAQADEMEEQLAAEAEDFLNRFLSGDRSHLEA